MDEGVRSFPETGTPVLHAGSHVVEVDVVGVLALETYNGFAAHFRVQVSVLTVILPHAGPTRVTTQVNHRSVCPRNASGTSLISRNSSTCAGQFTIERGTHVDALREERTTLRVGSTVDLVHTIDVGDTDFFHGLLLDALDDFLPLLGRLCHAVGHVQDGADLIFGDNAVQLGLVHLPPFLSLNALDAHIHLYHDILRRHATRQVEFLLDAVLLQHFLQSLDVRVLHVDALEGVDTFLDDINGQFAHLSDFLFQGHFAQDFLHTLLDFLVTRDGGRHGLCRGRQQGSCRHASH